MAIDLHVYILNTWTFLFTGLLSTVSIIVLFILRPTTFKNVQQRPTTDDETPNIIKRSKRPSKNKDTTAQHSTRTTVQVVVLGDVGRSPRMQYHALLLAQNKASVQLIGYQESPLLPEVQNSSYIKTVGIDKPPTWLQGGLFLINGPAKVLHQVLALFTVLAYKTEPSRYMLVQNPPSIPVLAIAVVVCYLRNTKLVIDWHNFGYSILALRLGNQHPLVIISKWYESFIGLAADAHFVVSNTMGRRLKKDFGITATTLYDRPGVQFQPMKDSTAFLEKCTTTKDYADELGSGARRLVISSTSWTADEDFGILLDALCAYRAEPLLVVITGKGPQKAEYEGRINRLKHAGELKDIIIRTAFLSNDDYPLLLAAATIGVCLHTSSSGVDFPMKILDMWGAGIPVLAYSDYEAFSEFIEEGKNAMGFTSSAELSDLLAKLLSTPNVLEELQRGARREGQLRWSEEWNRCAAKTFDLD